ncbi:hypothetical protein PCK1_000230 [Pneumocystis canis]|nr:hypothetical protein PCK1_000230 [Pneumocystis canis]
MIYRNFRNAINFFSWFSISWTKNYHITITPFKHEFSSYFYFDNSTVIWRSDDEGVSWTKIRNIPEKEVKLLVPHPFSNKMAFILGENTKHFYTVDQGMTWKKFTTELPFLGEKSPLAFNSGNPKYIIYTGANCTDSEQLNCIFKAYYTEDAFFTNPKLLKEDVKSCMFSKSSKEFVEGSDKLVFCIYMESRMGEKGLYLIKSGNWFIKHTNINFDGNSLVNLNGFRVIQTFIIAVVKKSQTSQLEMYISKDGNTWNKARFPYYHQEKLIEDSYTIMQSHPYSLQVDILTSSEYPHHSGISFKSDKSEHTNRNKEGFVDFENIEYINGTILVNIVENWEELRYGTNVVKKIQSRISFDNGNTWSPIKAPSNSNCNVFDSKLCSLHLHSVINKHRSSHIFSKNAPGILIGIGSVGSDLKPYDQCDVFVSNDAGRTWTLTLTDIIAAVSEGKTLNYIRQTIDLGLYIHPQILMTSSNPKTRKFILISNQYAKKNIIHDILYIISIDLSKIYTRKCILNKIYPERSDFEKWYHYNQNGNEECFMGTKQYFFRKKNDKKCYVEESNTELQGIEENCPCSDQDYEWYFNKLVYKFFKYNSKHIPHEIPQNECKSSNDMFLGSSGYRKIPGNMCDDKRGIMKDKKLEISCNKNNHSNKIIIKLEDFKGELINYFYLRKDMDNSSDDNQLDETILFLTSEMELYVSHDQGNEWNKILQNENIISVYQNIYANEQIYFLGINSKAWVTKNRFKTIRELKLPAFSHIGYNSFEFHPDNKDWIIYTGCKKNEILENCETVSYYSKDGGDSWSYLMSNVRSCCWIKTQTFNTDENMIYCEIYRSELEKSQNGPVKIAYSIDFFNTYHVLFDSAMGYARFEKFIILAEYDYKLRSLKPYVSLDGLNFVHAKFPSHYSEQAYTILDSTTGSIFLHVTSNGHRDLKWGPIIKSNSNGTDFVKLLDYVNRNSDGYVDFERLKGLEGLAISNVIINVNDVIKGATKRIKTLITYNDGSEWSYLTPPKTDSNGNRYCTGELEKCSLNLHGYSERTDFRNTFSSDKIPGLDFAIGNVGEYLDNYLASNTYMTTDGGITWKEIQKGPYLWKFGDQGSILLLTKDKHFLDHFHYSLDMGNTWNIVYFPNREMILVYDITTVYSDTSRKFLLFSTKNGSVNTMTTVYIDFTMLTDKKCELNQESQDKKKKRKNQIDINILFQKIHSDYNYERVSDGSCQLVKGLKPLDHLEECKKYNLLEYFEPTGYRRIPLTTCQGGKELDKSITSFPCPGKESEYNKLKKGLRGGWLFLVILSPFIVIIFGSYCIWILYKDRFLGQIRLGEDEIPSGWIQYPIILTNKITTLFFMISSIINYITIRITSIFSGFRGFNTRNSFSRGDYSILLPNSPELLYNDFQNS